MSILKRLFSSFRRQKIEDVTAQGYKVRLKDWKIQAGESLGDQISYRNLSVFNTKQTDHAIALMYPEVILGKDEHDHTRYSNPAHSVAAGLERLWFYERVVDGTLDPPANWWNEYLKVKAIGWARECEHNYGYPVPTCFRMAVCAFTPPTDSSPSSGAPNKPCEIVDAITEKMRAEGFQFDPDNIPFSEHFSDRDLMAKFCEVWANRESAVLWDENCYRDGVEIFQAFTQGQTIDTHPNNDPIDSFS